MLNDLQKETVRQWVADGAGLSDVQRRLNDEFGISMTYMDVRFLVLDLNAQVQDKPEPKPAVEETPPVPAATEEELTSEALPVEDEAADAPVADEGEGYTPPEMADANVKVELDRVVRAGALASGSVTFTDGVTGSWYLDRMGRLGLTKVSKPDYQPTEADLQAFQMELQNKLSAGY